MIKEKKKKDNSHQLVDQGTQPKLFDRWGLSLSLYILWT